MAGSLNAAAQYHKLGAHLAAVARSQRAARMEGATARGVDGIGYFTGNRHPVAAGHFNIRNGRQQQLSIGMKRIVEDIVHRGNFTESAQVHDPDMVRHVAHHGQIMGYEKIG